MSFAGLLTTLYMQMSVDQHRIRTVNIKPETGTLCIFKSLATTWIVIYTPEITVHMCWVGRSTISMNVNNGVS